MTLKRRLRKIEGMLDHSREGRQRPIICVVYDSDMPTEAQRETAIAEYKAKNPECVAREPKGFDVVYVVSETAKHLTEQVIRGEGTEKSP